MTKYISSLNLTVESSLSGVICAVSYAHGYKRRFMGYTMTEAIQIAKREVREKMQQSTTPRV